MRILSKNDQKMIFFGFKQGKKECYHKKQDKIGLKIIKIHLQPEQKNTRSSSMGTLGFIPSKITKKQTNLAEVQKKISNQQRVRLDQNNFILQRNKSVKQKLVSEFVEVKTIEKQQYINTAASQEKEENVVGDQQKINWKNRPYGAQATLGQKQQAQNHLDHLKQFRDRKHSFLKLNTPILLKKQYHKFHIFSQFSISALDGDNQVSLNANLGKFKGRISSKAISFGQQFDYTGEIKEKVHFEEQRYKQLQEKIEQSTLTIKQKGQQLLNIQKNVQNAKTLLFSFESKINDFHDQMAHIQQEKQKLTIFLHTQPSKILRSEVEGYKKCEQQLFDLAQNLEMSTYEKMLYRMNQQIEVPEGSFYYIIDHFQKGFSCGQHNCENTLQKVKSIYQNIKEHVMSILRVKANKIQAFVSTLLKLASFTIGKREYIQGLNKKMSILFGKYCVEFSYFKNTICNEKKEDLSKQLVKLSQIFKQITIAFSEAQIFY